MNRTPGVFLTQNPLPQPSADLISLCREALTLLFPNTQPVKGPAERLTSPSCYFLREGGKIHWVEIISTPFSRVEICDYLAKARQVRTLFPSGISGILAAPEFEPGVRELLELIEFPIQCLRYREALPLGLREPSQNFLRGPLLWIEPVHTYPSQAPRLAIEPPYAGEEKIVPLPESESVALCQRLSREELREFIQLELDAVSGKADK